MTQKERALIVLTVLLGPKKTSEPKVDKAYVIEKIDACIWLQRPEVLLDEVNKKRFEALVEELRRKGKII